MKPALTREEWVNREYTEQVDDGGEVRFSSAIDPARLVLWWDGTPLPIQRRSALAALCLHDQEFGFTRDGLESLKAVLGMAELWMASHGPSPENEGHLLAAVEEVRKVQALLPPEAP